jgi:hypothetical protein
MSYMSRYGLNMRLRHLESDVAVAVQDGFPDRNFMQIAIALNYKDACVDLPVVAPVYGFLHIVVKHGR